MAKKPLEPEVHVRKDLEGMTPLQAQAKYDCFLSTYASKPIITDALAKAGLTLPQVLERKRLDPAFARQFADAEECAQYVAEAEAYRRATVGWEEPVFNKEGVLVGSITRYSDSLLQFILKGNVRKYRGEDISASRGLSDEARRQLAQMQGLLAQ